MIVPAGSDHYVDIAPAYVGIIVWGGGGGGGGWDEGTKR